MNTSTTTKLAGWIKRETDKAILFHSTTDSKEEWLPLSQVYEIHRAEDYEDCYIVVASWLATKKELS